MKWTILFICLCIFSCRSVQYVPVEKTKIEYRDRNKSDSATIKEIVNTRDSVIFRDSVVYTYNDKGELMKSEIWHWREKYSDINKLYAELISRYDSLYQSRQDSIQVPYPIEVIKHKVPCVMWWIVIILSALSLPFIFKIIRFFRGKI